MEKISINTLSDATVGRVCQMDRQNRTTAEQRSAQGQPLHEIQECWFVITDEEGDPDPEEPQDVALMPCGKGFIRETYFDSENPGGFEGCYRLCQPVHQVWDPMGIGFALPGTLVRANKNKWNGRWEVSTPTKHPVARINDAGEYEVLNNAGEPSGVILEVEDGDNTPEEGKDVVLCFFNTTDWAAGAPPEDGSPDEFEHDCENCGEWRPLKDTCEHGDPGTTISATVISAEVLPGEEGEAQLEDGSVVTFLYNCDEEGTPGEDGFCSIAGILTEGQCRSAGGTWTPPTPATGPETLTTGDMIDLTIGPCCELTIPCLGECDVETEFYCCPGELTEVCSDGGTVDGCESRDDNNTIEQEQGESRCIEVAKDQGLPVDDLYETLEECEENCGREFWCCGSSGICEQVSDADQCLTDEVYNTRQECEDNCLCCDCSDARNISETRQDNGVWQSNDTIDNDTLLLLEEIRICPEEAGGTTFSISGAQNITGVVTDFGQQGVGGQSLTQTFLSDFNNGTLLGSGNIINIPQPRNPGTFPNQNNHSWSSNCASTNLPPGMSIPDDGLVFPLQVPYTYSAEHTINSRIIFGQAVSMPFLSPCRVCFPDAIIETEVTQKITVDGQIVYEESCTYSGPPAATICLTDLEDVVLVVRSVLNFNSFNPGAQTITWSHDVAMNWDLSPTYPPCTPGLVQSVSVDRPGQRLKAIFARYSAGECSRCNATAAKMDRWGTAKCVENFDLLVAEVRDNISKFKWWKRAVANAAIASGVLDVEACMREALGMD